jgi:hypothetical protein
MAFSKGQSGNPGGRPKAVVGVAMVARENCPRAIERLAELMDSDDERVAVAACNAVLDRGLGKPAQSIRKTVTHVRKNPRELSLEELEKRLAELSAQEPAPH